ncbi:MAG: lipoyl(octanoyl) transferase LipB [Chloroflexi bacterium]|nr:lipoyl(octanoyl) transferase LipB [Chloroflexota bacterium]
MQPGRAVGVAEIRTGSSPARCVLLLDAGLVPYPEAQAMQQQLVSWREADLIHDVLLLLEHLPAFTLGRRADERHILAPPEMLAREGIAVCRTERGGDVTYHGPGQLVGYPILRLADYGLGPSDYMHRLEDVIAGALAEYGVQTHRREGIIGVWVGENKIAALGVRIRRGITFHGFALNVAPNMEHWKLIIPCGITDGGVTSLARELPETPPMSDVRRRTASQFGRLFRAQVVPTTWAGLERAVAQRVAPSG